MRASYLIHSGHSGSFVQEQLHNLNVPHLGGLDQGGLSILVILGHHILEVKCVCVTRVYHVCVGGVSESVCVTCVCGVVSESVCVTCVCGVVSESARVCVCVCVWLVEAGGLGGCISVCLCISVCVCVLVCMCVCGWQLDRCT